MRWQVTTDEYRAHPGRSAINPEGLPVRTVGEVQLIELGPTLFPVYATTSASASATTRTGLRPTYPPVSHDALLRALGQR